MSIKKRLQDFSDSLDLSKRFPGYFYRPIFIGCVFILVLFFGVTLWTNGWGDSYLECPSTATVCYNPEYNPACALGSLCSIEYLKSGEVIGHKPNILAQEADLIIILIVGGAFALNHWKYTRGRK